MPRRTGPTPRRSKQPRAYRFGVSLIPC
jgi:hypothetical protein